MVVRDQPGAADLSEAGRIPKYRTQGPDLFSFVVPFFNMPLSRLKLCPNATSLPTVIVRSRIS
jgi:hypothetical protein